MLLSIVQGGVVVLAIGILIFVHELGHFLVAKKVGIRVEAFSLGFGPTIWGFTRGDTTYKLSLIPLGGYVKMAGEFKEEGDESTGEEFFGKTISQRAWVVSAGVIMNIFFAIIAFPLAFTIGVPFEAPVVGSVAPGSAAWEAGILPGDRVSKIDDSDVISFTDIRTSVAFSDDEKTFTLIRNGKEITKTVTPRYDENQGLHLIGMYGSKTYFFDEKAEELPPGIEPGMELVAVQGVPVTAGLSMGPGAFREGELMALTVREPESETTKVVSVPAKFEKIDDDTMSIGVGTLRTRVASLRPTKDNSPSAAQALGLMKNDVILKIAGEDISDLNGIQKRIFAMSGQKDLSVLIHRDGKEMLLQTDKWDGDPASFLSSFQLEFNDGIQVSVFPGSQADISGLKNGDMLISYAGKKLKKGMDGWKQFTELKEDAKGKSETIIVSRGGEELTFPIKAAPSMVNTLLKKLKLRPLQERVQLAFPQSMTAGFSQAVSQFKSILMTLKSLVAGKVAAKNMGGIITIAVVSYTFVEQGLGKILFFMAILSLNLAILNILPIPVLDGGHLMFLAMEKIKGGPLSERIMGYANVLGLVFILGLMVFVTYQDIVRFFFKN